MRSATPWFFLASAWPSTRFGSGSTVPCGLETLIKLLKCKRREGQSWSDYGQFLDLLSRNGVPDDQYERQRADALERARAFLAPNDLKRAAATLCWKASWMRRAFRLPCPTAARWFCATRPSAVARRGSSDEWAELDGEGTFNGENQLPARL